MKPQVLELTANEVFALLQALGKQPYDEVADLIAKIRSQCELKDEADTERTDFDG
ncbi:hypothetical protein [Propionivibrio limicola]|uniref:hypothetical protein n=1 Tax=Propionivibrio limicola TaxID=167645 RepID=UPI0012920DF4|nr:hypothetical protein [Propionivibrio limicola]